MSTKVQEELAAEQGPVTVDVLRNSALGNDTRNPSCLADAVLWLAAEVRELRLSLERSVVS